MKSALFILILVLSSTCFAWEEDPRIEAHNKLTEKLIKIGNKQVEEGDEDTMKLLSLMHSERQKKTNEAKNE